MITRVNFFNNFKCLKTECNHNCCIGWTINIDKKTLEFYKKDKNALSERFTDGIDFNSASFKLTKDNRCPFLNQNNLCDVVINLGKEKLCRICKDHPIYRNYLSDRTETGYGIACESACKCVTEFKEKATLITLNARKRKFTLTPFERKMLSFRSKILKTIQNRTIPFETRLRNVLRLCAVNESRILNYDWKNFLLSLEILSTEWSKKITDASFNNVLFSNSENEIVFEQLFCYFLFRHLSSAVDETDMISKTLFAVVSVFIIDNLSANKDLTFIEETARGYSAETEYSENNLNAFFDLLDELSLCPL